MGFPAAIKSTDPGGFLLGLGKIGKITSKDAHQAVPVFAITNKGFQLVADSFRIEIVIAGNTFVDECPSQWIIQEYFAVFHKCYRSDRIGTAR